MSAIVSLLVEAQALRFGDFTLKDGSKSPIFVDLGRVAHAADVRTLGELFATAIGERFPDANVLFGPAYKGIAIATTTAVALAARGCDVAVFFDRKEAKAHGEGGTFIGHAPLTDDRVVVLDDVTTSGATKREAYDAIERRFGVRPIGGLVAIDRTRGRSDDLAALNLHALATLADIATHLEATGHEHAAAVRAYAEGK